MAARELIIILAAAAVSFAAPSIPYAGEIKLIAQTGQTERATPSKSGYVAVNGLNYYYQVYGKGEPLLLLHGGLGQI